MTTKDFYVAFGAFIVTLIIAFAGLFLFNKLMALAEVEAQFDRATYQDELEGYIQLMEQDERNSFIIENGY